ncbi:MAG: hypothetical protein ABEK01_03630 [Candidatus Nanohaloarchaea archaeon]
MRGERKGLDMSIKTVAMMVLGVMVIALVFAAFQSQLQNLLNNFIQGLPGLPSLSQP